MDGAEERRVCFHPLAKAFTVRGEILKKWESMGAQQGKLGYPVSEEQLYRRLGATVMVFQRGRIVSHPETGTFYLSGDLEREWCDTLGVSGPLGPPLADPEQVDGVLWQRFAGGVLRKAPARRRVDLRGEIARRGIAVRDQRPRPTCSVQVMVFLLEYQYARLLGTDFSHLSVEFSNHMANVADGTRTDGHCFHNCQHGYDRFGILRERRWPYQAQWPYDFDAAQRLVTDEMLCEAAQMLSGGLWLSGRFVKPLDGKPGLSGEQFQALLGLLDQGIPVGVGRDHSLAAVGYRMEDSAPGGGYVLFRNSYGTTMDFLGYQEESFDSVIRTVNDLFVYDPPLAQHQ